MPSSLRPPVTPALTGKVVLVTGAGSGIGRASAEACAAAGASVVVSDIVESDGRETAERITARGGAARFRLADVSVEHEVDGLIEYCLAHYGRLDCAHNNAGILGAQRRLHEISTADWERSMSINLTGLFLCLRAELAVLLRGGGGAIVNTASTFGMVGCVGLPDYVTSKHGVVGLTRAVALDHAPHGIRVNAVCPGVIHTPMIEPALQHPGAIDPVMAQIPTAVLGTPEQVAAAVVWLCSQAASYITGVAMPVDAGWTAQ